MEHGFRGPQVCSIVGITYRQLDYWARTNLVRPSITEAHGSGSARRYSHADLIRLFLVVRLTEQGLSLQRIRQILPSVTVDEFAGWLVVCDDRALLAPDVAALAQVIVASDTMPLMLVPLAGLAELVAARAGDLLSAA